MMILQRCWSYTNIYLILFNFQFIYIKELIVDTAAVYNPAYESIRSAITRATKGDFNELNVKMEVNLTLSIF